MFFGSCAQTEVYVEPPASRNLATIEDSFSGKPGGVKATIFTVDAIDGTRDDKSPFTFVYGGGFATNVTAGVNRKVTPGEHLVTIGGRDVHGADGAALLDFNKNKTVKGDVFLNAKPGRTYIVRGQMSKSRSSVWLEDKKTGRIVGRKVVSN